MPCKNHPTVHANLNQCSRCSDLLCADCLVLLSGKYFCANCKGEQVKDIQSGTSDTELDMASIGRRFAAVLIDGLILGIPMFVIFFSLGVGFIGLGGNAGAGGLIMMQLVATVAAAGIQLLYEALMIQNYGQTLGKMAMKIKVVNPEGNPITTGQAWGRGGLKVLFGQLGILGIINYLFAFGKGRTTLHDRAAKTRVVNWNR